MHGKEHHIMWEQEWLEGKISKEEALERAKAGENITELLQSMERVSQFQVKTYVPKETAWELLEEKIAAGKKSKVILMPRRYWITGVAASFILAIGALFLFQQSSIDQNDSLALKPIQVSTQMAQTEEIKLPDGSMVYLNADSKVSYVAGNWDKDRLIDLEGEAFFEVEKGARFVVSTEYGSVEVLGTSFNVSTRNGRLEVACKTGKVKVTATGGQSSQTITPGQMVTAEAGVVHGAEAVDSDQVGSWRVGEFEFESVMLAEVLQELERQYDVTLEYNEKDIANRVYTGYFSKGDIKEAIKFICVPMGLKYEIDGDNIRIMSNQDSR